MNCELFRVENVTVLNKDVKMLSQAWFYINEGETMGVLGQYNSGRTELLEVICGKKQSLEARLYYKECLQDEWNEEVAYCNGIVCVSGFEELFLDFDVTFNIFLRRNTTQGIFLSKKNLHKKCQKLLNQLEIPILPDIAVCQLSQTEKLLTMIARAVALNAKLIVLENVISIIDELQLKHFKRLFQKLNKMGISVALFDGDIQALSMLADRVVVIRDGRIVSNCRKPETDEKRLTTIMLGKELDIRLTAKEVSEDTAPVMQVYYKRDMDKKRLLFSIPQGSLTGIVVSTEADVIKMEQIFEGVDPAYQIILNNHILKMKEFEKHVGLIHEQSMVFSNMDLEENITLNYQKIYSKMLYCNPRSAKIAMNNRVKPFFRKELEEIYRKHDMGTLRHLEKKIVEICRNLIIDPDILVYINPVYRTGSIASKQFLEKIIKLRDYGYTSLLVSDEIRICTAVCNHILFYKNNHIAGEFFMNLHSEEEVLEFYRSEFWK